MHQPIPATTVQLTTATRTTYEETARVWNPIDERWEWVGNGVTFYRYTPRMSSGWIVCVDFRAYAGQTSKGTMVVWYNSNGALQFTQLHNVHTLELARVLRGWAISKAGERSMGAALHRVRKAVERRNGQTRQPKPRSKREANWQRTAHAFHRPIVVNGHQLAAR
jgi:hypothetical protein